MVVPTAHADGVVLLALERWEREKDRKRDRDKEREKQVNSGDSWSELAEVGRRRERERWRMRCAYVSV